MSTLSLDEALRIVHPWLGTWQPGYSCRWCSLKREQLDELPCQNRRHDAAHERVPIPMPPATDVLMGCVLRRLTQEGSCHLSWEPSSGEEKYRWFVIIEGHLLSEEIDPCHAVIIAAGMWLQQRGKE